MSIPDLVKSQNSITADSIACKAADYFEEAKEEESLASYLKVLEKDPEHFDALWHTALLYARIGFRMDLQREKENYYKRSLDFAEKTLELYPDKGYSHFVYAVAQGRMSDISSSGTRIEKSHIIKEHADKAVQLLPDYGPAWHLLGVWNSKIANIGSAQRFAAGLFSRGIPEGASNKKAEEHIKKALELKPDQAIRFKFDLAQHYDRSGQKQKAIDTLKQVVQESPQNQIDEWNLQRAKKLLEELS
ncbi:tetratricopeptide repeat protein [Gracilimonas halophila]|uniref:Regulator of microtubule dynamics protein 1 n=1 Tax=Gracilimonas halophila TaxID=1834464 RepID=A0ABW5JGC8_9BACT